MEENKDCNIAMSDDKLNVNSSRDNKNKVLSQSMTNLPVTNGYFKGSRVGSCSRILLKNGQALAVCFNTNKKNTATYSNLEKSPISTYR